MSNLAFPLSLFTGSSAGSGGGGFYSLADDAAIIAAAGASSLTGTPCIYVATDTGNVYSCPSASEAYFLAYGSQQASYRGAVTTVSALNAVANPFKGDQALLDLSGMPFPFVCCYTGSAWRAAAQLLIEVDGGAGTTSASEQCAASWIQALPAGLLQLFRRLDVPMALNRNNTTHDFTTLNLRLGSSSAGLTGAALVTTSGNVLTTTDVARDSVFSFSLNSTNLVKPRSPNNKVSGSYAGSSSSGSTSEVTLGGSDDFGDALYFSATATMSGTSTTPSISYALVLTP